MALTTRKKNIILADWKTGNFKSITALAKHYKIDAKTAKKIVGEITPEHSDIVEFGVSYESAKNSLKNPVEITAIEKAVKNRIEYADLFEKSAVRNQKIANTALDAVENMQENAKDEEEKGAIAITSMQMLKDHSQITSKNKDVVIGKDADTQVNIQNNNQLNNISVEWE